MNIKDVEALAELAKLDMSMDEKEAMLKDMGSILEYVKVIERVEVENKKPVYDIYNVWREDKEEPREFSKQLIAEQFPDSQEGFLKVKKILKNSPLEGWLGNPRRGGYKIHPPPPKGYSSRGE